MVSALRPTFFELYAAEQLSGALQPALRFTLEVLSVRHPALTRLAEHADEAFAAISLAFELTSLRRDSATLAEAFCSLRRAPTFKGAASRAPLRPRHVLTSIIWSVLLPYIRRKMEDRYMAERARARSSAPQRPRLQRRVSFREDGNALSRTTRAYNALYPRLLRAHDIACRLLVRLYPAFNAAADGAQLLGKLLYLLESSHYFTPALAAQGLVLRRLSAAELHGLAGPSSGASRSVLQRIMGAGDTAVTAVKYAIFAALVAFRFLEYYHAAEVCSRALLCKRERAISNTSAQGEAPSEHVPIPPPPEPLEPARNAVVKLPQRADVCPLCSQTRVNPSALVRFPLCGAQHQLEADFTLFQIVSGYVFCHTCIEEHIAENKKCPVTLLPAVHGDIRRVYPGGAYVGNMT